MNILQGDKKTVNGDKVSTLDCILGAIIAAPILAYDLFLTPEGWAALNDLGADLIETAKEEWGELGELGVAMILANISPILFLDDALMVVVDDVKQLAEIAIDKFNKMCEIIVNKIEEFGKKITEFAADVGEALLSFADNVRETWNKVTQSIVDFAGEIIDSGKDFVDGVIDTGKDIIDSAVDAGKDFVDGVIDAGKDFVDGVLDTGKDIVDRVWETGQDIAKGIADAGKGVADGIVNAGKGIKDGIVDAGKGIVDAGKGIVNKVGETGKAISDKVSEFRDKFLSAVSSFFGSVTNGVKRFISMFGKDGVIRKSVVNTWNSAVDKAKQTVSGILGTVRTQIKDRCEDFKEGVSNLLDKAKKSISLPGIKGTNFTKSLGKKVLRGIGTYLSGKLSVDLIRLADLQKKLGNLERDFGEQTVTILKEANKVTTDVKRQYSESYVQQQIISINKTCDQLKSSNRRLCDMLQKKTDSLKYAVSHYRDKEKMICKNVIA
ncbi:MAG: hypothetical protein GX660_27700, partial [Clostridiaceae bacterium]|nr:hypothetical protein [Clostridiaceae bacterium]